MYTKVYAALVMAIMLVALLGATDAQSKLRGVEIERLGNKLVVHLEVQGSVTPILRFDEASKEMRITLEGVTIPSESMTMPLTDSDRPWVAGIGFEPLDTGLSVLFKLGNKANPLDFIVQGGVDEVIAVIYTDGTTGFGTSEASFGKAPSERIAEVDLSKGLDLEATEVVEEPAVQPDEEVAVTPATPDAQEPETTESPVVETPENTAAEPAEESAGEESDSGFWTGDLIPEPTVPNYVVEGNLPNPPLFLDSGKGDLYENLFGSGGSGKSDDGEASFRYSSGANETMISLTVDEMPLGLVIASLIDSTDYNVIISDAVANKTVSSLTLDRISLFEALDLLTRSYNLSYVVEYNTIVVGEKDTLEANFGKLITKSFWLDYADGASVMSILINMKLAREGNVQVYNGETEYLSVNGASTLSGVTGTEGASTKEIKEMPSLVSTARRNMLVVTETEERMTRIAQVIADLDKKPKQIRLETEIMEITETGSKKLGLEMTDSLGVAVLQSGFGEVIPGDSPAEGAVESFKFQTFARDPLQFTMSLNHLIEDGDGKVLAKPNMSAVDGTQAIYFAGQEVPYISSPAQTQGSTYTPATVEFKTVGITLNFKPRIDRDGNITIEVNPQVSSLVGFIDLGSGAQAPQTRTRQATATVRVKSGDVFVLGGMISDEEREGFSRIPFFHKLPLFGPLFETKTTKKEKTEIVVILRPMIEE